MLPDAENILMLFSQRQGQGGANVRFFPHLFFCFIFAWYLEIQMLEWLTTIPMQFLHRCIHVYVDIFKLMLWLNFLSAFMNSTGVRHTWSSCLNMLYLEPGKCWNLIGFANSTEVQYVQDHRTYSFSTQCMFPATSEHPNLETYVH